MFTVNVPIAISIVMLAMLAAIEPSFAMAQVLVWEHFTTDPITAGRATTSDPGRFTHSVGDGTLRAAYHSGQPTTKLLWDLGQTLTQDDAFQYSAAFSIRSDGYAPDDTGGIAQISFGLVNAVTTGTRRTGNPVDPSSDTFDVVSVDYFPTDNPFFDSITITPTVFQSQLPPSTDAFDGIEAPFGQESQITDLGEVGALDTDKPFTMALMYAPSSRIVTVTLDDENGPVIINNIGKDDPFDGSGSTGGPDANIFTIQHQLPMGSIFAVDRFGILLWEDGYDKLFSGAGVSSLVADVDFDSFQVVLPEPMSLVIVSWAALFCLWGRRRPNRLAKRSRWPGVTPQGAPRSGQWPLDPSGSATNRGST